MSASDRYAPILQFDADGEFARGFEAGRAWEMLKADPESLVDQTLHATNTEMLMRMGEALGLRIAASPLIFNETWIAVTAIEEAEND